MLLVHLPSMLVALIPVALIEALVYRSYVRKSFADAWKGSCVANLISMFVGIPIAWVALVIVEFAVGGGQAYGLRTPMQRLVAVTLQAPWLIPYEEDLYWMVPAATLTLLVPFLLVSIGVEFGVLRRRWKSPSDQLRLLRGVWLANLLSYSLLAAICLVQLVIAGASHPPGHSIGVCSDSCFHRGVDRPGKAPIDAAMPRECEVGAARIDEGTLSVSAALNPLSEPMAASHGQRSWKVSAA